MKIEWRINASLFVFALLSRALSQELPVLLEGPKDGNASIRQQSFLSCLFGNILEKTFPVKWKINDRFISTYGEETLTKDAMQKFCPQNKTILTNLSIVFLKIIDSDTQLTELNITCIGYSLSLNKSISSDPALLRIQGTLDRPPDLTVQLTLDQSKMIIQWNHPYTLMDVYILSYFVNITYFNSSDERNATTISGSMTLYEYSVPKGCTNYDISVQAKTLSGLGDASFINESVSARAPKKLTTEEVTLNVAYIDGNFSLHITFCDSDCELEQADKVDIEIYNGSNVIYVGNNVNLEHDGNTSRDISLSLPSTLQHLHVNMTLTLTNTAENKSTTSTPIPLSIFNIQGLSIDPVQSGVEVMCEFATGSDDLNCRVEIQCCNEIPSDDSTVYIIDLTSLSRTANFTPCDHKCQYMYYCFCAFDASVSTPAVMEGEVVIPDGKECPSGTPNATTTAITPEDTTSNTGITIGILISVLLLTVLVTVVLTAVLCYSKTLQLLYRMQNQAR